jgi:hypothetical protein
MKFNLIGAAGGLLLAFAGGGFAYTRIKAAFRRARGWSAR